MWQGGVLLDRGHALLGVKRSSNPCGKPNHSFARVGAVVGMKVEEYYIQKHRGWVRLHEKAARSTNSPTTTAWNSFWMNG
jgi:hypothetical protein